MVMVTLEGNLYTVGTGEQGQLGRVAEIFSNRGGRQGLGRLKSPPGGPDHFRTRRSLTACGFYGWRLPEESRLTAAPVIADRFLIPQIVIIKGKVQFVDAFCGSYVTFAVSKDGHVYGFGLSNYHQLGQNVDHLWITDGWSTGHNACSLNRFCFFYFSFQVPKTLRRVFSQ